MDLSLRSTSSVDAPTPITPIDNSVTRSSGDEMEVNAGAHLDRYIVVEAVGRGGMGHVLRAYDPTLQREVALKLVNAEAVTINTRERVIREARAMARLSHPNVVVVHDVCETSSGITLVMEYIRGPTLRTWLGARPRNALDVIQHFVAAGRGLEAAHGAALLHRDFKPANVLVGPAGVIKVSDFGLATRRADDDRATEQDDAVARLDIAVGGVLTQARTVLGTPRYMAPEQMRGAPLTAAADQYAFCVAVWEALCGDAPFVHSRFASLARLKERGAPHWPANAPSLPRSATEALRRGLSPLPTDRWPNMGALLAVLDAAPRRRLRRTRIAITVGCVLLVGGAATGQLVPDEESMCKDGGSRLTGIWDDRHRDVVRRRTLATGLSFASQAWDRIDRSLTRYADTWATAHEETCIAAVRHDLSNRMAALRHDCLARAKLRMGALAEVLAEANKAAVVEAHSLVARLPPISRCMDDEALVADAGRSYAPRGPDPLFERLRSQLAKADAAIAAGLFDLAERELESVRQAATALRAPELDLELATSTARLLESKQELDAAERAYRSVLRRAASLGNLPAMETAAVRLMVVVGYAQARPDGGLHYRELAEGLAAGDLEREVGVSNALGLIARGRGSFSEAEAHSRRAVALEELLSGPAAVTTALLRTNVGMNLQSQNQADAAATEFEQALPIIERALGPGHPSVLATRNNLGTLLLDDRDFAGAEALFAEILGPTVAVFGPDHLHVASVLGNLGNALLMQGRPQEALPHLRQTVAIQQRVLPKDHPDIATSRYDLGSAAMGLGSYVTAEAEFLEALRIRFVSLPIGHAEIASVQLSLAECMLALDRGAEARAAAEEAWRGLQGSNASAALRLGAAFVLARTLVGPNASPEDRTRAASLGNHAHDLALESADTASRIPAIADFLREQAALGGAHAKRSRSGRPPVRSTN